MASIAFIWSNCQKSINSDSVESYGDIDVAGKLHNEGLDFVAKRINFQDASKEKLFDATKDFMLSKNPDWINRKDFMESRASTKLDYISSSSVTDSEVSTQIVIDLCNNRSSIEQDYILQIAKVIEQLSNTYDATPSFASIQQNIVKDKRQNIDKKLLLGAVSIAKYSAIYWKEAVNNSKNGWYPILQQRISSRIGSPFSMSTLRDVAGFANNYPGLMDTYAGTVAGEQYAWDTAVQGGIYESTRSN
jgi:hypothetical protein